MNFSPYIMGDSHSWISRLMGFSPMYGKGEGFPQPGVARNQARSSNFLWTVESPLKAFLKIMTECQNLKGRLESGSTGQGIGAVTTGTRVWSAMDLEIVRSMWNIFAVHGTEGFQSQHVINKVWAEIHQMAVWTVAVLEAPVGKKGKYWHTNYRIRDKMYHGY